MALAASRPSIKSPGTECGDWQPPKPAVFSGVVQVDLLPSAFAMKGFPKERWPLAGGPFPSDRLQLLFTRPAPIWGG